MSGVMRNDNTPGRGFASCNRRFVGERMRDSGPEVPLRGSGIGMNVCGLKTATSWAAFLECRDLLEEISHFLDARGV